jgi:hypothetical protein
MPHVVVVGAARLQDIASALAPFSKRVDGCTIKADVPYLELTGRSLLLPVLTASGQLRQRFLVLCSERDDGSLAVRLDTMTDPEKTRPVQLALALVARRVLAVSPGASIGPTNLADAVAAIPEDATR